MSCFDWVEFIAGAGGRDINSFAFLACVNREAEIGG